MNEGTLGRMQFGGERAHTNDHPPIFRDAAPSVSGTAIKVGTLIYLDDGEAAVWTPALNKPIHGVVDLPYEPGDDSVLYLAHGTVKKDLLKDGSESELDAAAITALEEAGIYPV